MLANGKTFDFMFGHCYKFDRPLGGWEVGRAESLYMMFNYASMQAAYQARYRQVRDVRVDFIIYWIWPSI